MRSYKLLLKGLMGFNKDSLNMVQKAVYRLMVNLDIGTDIRYRPIVQIIRKSKKEAPSIIDIGSGKVGITSFLKQKVIGVDIAFDDNPSLGLLEEKLYNGSKLEYLDNSFDFVISVDTLEHIPRDGRGEIIAEMLRIAKKYIIFAFPCSERSQFYEKKLEISYMQRGLPIPKYLIEHKKCGLPDENEIIRIIKQNLKKNLLQYDLTVLHNENLKLWYLHEIIKSKGAIYFYPSMVVIKLILFLMPFLTSMGVCYRRIIIIKKRQKSRCLKLRGILILTIIILLFFFLVTGKHRGVDTIS